MSTVTETNRLLALTEAGVSVWLDQIRRSLVQSGELARMIAEDCLRGMTANPSIFEKAILGSADYDEELERLAREQLGAAAIYERLAVRDVQLAADALSNVHRASGGRDGFVSLEVSPALAHDTDGTLAEVRSYGQRLERPNAMIKIPGVEQLIAESTGKRGRGRALLTGARAPRYVAIMGFLPPSERLDEAVTELEIPGAGYSFGTLIAAQAAGDLLTLRAHGLPAERVRLEGAPATAVRALERIAVVLAGA